MSHSSGPIPSSASDRRIWRISVISASLSFVFAFIAYCLLGEKPAHWLDAVYRGVHLLLLHAPHEELEEAATRHETVAQVLLYAARLLAVVAFAATSLALLVRLLGRELGLVRAARKGGHAIICGLGPVGKELAHQMIAKGSKVVVIDHGEDASALNGVLESGANVIVGDPLDPAFLRKAGVASARFFFAASNDDTMNISVGLRAIGLLETEPAAAGGKPVEVHVHVAEPQLRAALHRRRVLADTHARYHATTFSIFDTSARLLLRDHPLDHVRIRANDPRHVQLVLVGFGAMGEAILVRAALAGHYANLKRLKIAVIDAGAKRAEKVFRSRYPQFDRVADAQFLDLDPDDPDTQSQIAALCENAVDSISTVVVPLEQPTRALTVALSIASRLRCPVPIRFRLDHDAGIGDLIQKHHHTGVTPCPITPFGTIAAACGVENWTESTLDVMAKALHEDYVSKLGETEKNYPANPSAAPWDLLSEQLRESNRQAADHIEVKLRAIGCHLADVNSGAPGELVPNLKDDLEMLAKMEHRRWMAERYLAGWVQGPKDTEKRITPYLVEWDDLPTHPTDIQEYDRNSVRLLPGVLKKIGREIRK